MGTVGAKTNLINLIAFSGLATIMGEVFSLVLIQVLGMDEDQVLFT